VDIRIYRPGKKSNEIALFFPRVCLRLHPRQLLPSLFLASPQPLSPPASQSFAHCWLVVICSPARQVFFLRSFLISFFTLHSLVGFTFRPQARLPPPERPAPRRRGFLLRSSRSGPSPWTYIGCCLCCWCYWLPSPVATARRVWRVRSSPRLLPTGTCVGQQETAPSEFLVCNLKRKGGTIPTPTTSTVQKRQRFRP